MKSADHPALGTCLDSFHILSRGSDPKGIEDIPGEKIFFLQLADAPLLAMDVLQWSRHYRCFPGQGGFDVAGLVRHVLRAGYRGPLSLEVFNDVFRQSEAGPTAVDARRSLLTLQETVGLAAPPAPAPPTGIAFAELVTPDAAPVSAVLGALGFTRTARHRGKPVDLWQHGEARVLVNTGPAERRDGTRLAAVGLESPDPAGAARRAEALLAPVLPRRRAPGDAELEAVAAPDGTELFFCATGRSPLPDWRADFEDVVPAPHDGGPWRVDHLSLAQPWHQFDEAALFHRSVLGLRPQESVDVADPYGLLRSRAVSTDDGAVRIALTVGPAPTDDTAHAQHLALATDDVVAAARRYREAGGPLLPIPANYYDDLAARFGVRRRGAGDVPGAGHPLRPRRARHLPALLHAHRRPGLLRTGPARRRLPGLRRGERAGPAGGAARGAGVHCRLTVRVRPAITVVARIHPVMMRTYASVWWPPSGAKAFSCPKEITGSNRSRV